MTKPKVLACLRKSVEVEEIPEMTSDGFRKYRPSICEGIYVRAPQVETFLVEQGRQLYLIDNKGGREFTREEWRAVARYMETYKIRDQPRVIEDSDIVGKLIQDPSNVENYNFSEMWAEQREKSLEIERKGPIKVV